jgi:hypothetical protein
MKCFACFIFLSSLFAGHAMAYVGPGVGLSAVGAFFAVVAGAIVAIFGFIWYPIRRLIRKKRISNGIQGSKDKKE